MISPNDPPVTPDWIPPLPRAWDDQKCCPAECALCDDPSIPTNVVLGTE